MPYDNPKAYAKDVSQATSRRLPATGAQGRAMKVPAASKLVSPKHARKQKGTVGKGQKYF